MVPLHNLTDRYDNFHMEATAQNMSGTTRWYYALMSGILHDRQIPRASMEIAANSRKIICDLHFRKGNQQEGYNVPPITDLILCSDVVFGVEPPLARHPDEEIVIDTPITQHEPLHWEQLDPEDFDSEFMRTMAQEITETDRVFLNPDLDAEVTITVEPTDTVQQTVTEIDGDVDGRLSEDRAIEKLNKEELEAIRFIDSKDLATLDIAEIFTEPTAKSAPKPKSKPMPRRPPTPPRGRGTSRSPAASPRGSVGRVDHSQDIDGVWLGKGDFPEMRMKQSDKAFEALGKMMSFMLRGWANDRGVTHLNFDPMMAVLTLRSFTRPSPKGGTDWQFGRSWRFPATTRGGTRSSALLRMTPPGGVWPATGTC